MSLSSLLELKKTYSLGTKSEIGDYVARSQKCNKYVAAMWWGELIALNATRFIPDGDTYTGEFLGAVILTDLVLRFGSSLLSSAAVYSGHNAREEDVSFFKCLQPMSRESGIVGKVRELVNR